MLAGPRRGLVSAPHETPHARATHPARRSRDVCSFASRDTSKSSLGRGHRGQQQPATPLQPERTEGPRPRRDGHLCPRSRTYGAASRATGATKRLRRSRTVRWRGCKWTILPLRRSRTHVGHLSRLVTANALCAPAARNRIATSCGCRAMGGDFLSAPHLHDARPFHVIAARGRRRALLRCHCGRWRARGVRGGRSGGQERGPHRAGDTEPRYDRGNVLQRGCRRLCV